MAVKNKYEEIAEKIASLVRCGTLPVGERIPSLRAMSRQNGVSVMTVLQAYRMLEDKGLIASRPQSGYYVRPEYCYSQGPGSCLPKARMEPVESEASEVKIPHLIERLIRLDHENLIPLGAGLQDASYYPTEQLSLHMARIIRRTPSACNRYCFEPGIKELRIELARRMMEAGCQTSPDEIIVTSGATQALFMCLQALTSPGDAVAVESPGYYGFYSLLELLRLRAVEITCDPQSGMSLPALEKVLQSNQTIRCVLLSSNFSNPTGASLSEDNKKRMTSLCSEHQLPIIEDDVYGELAFNLLRPRALKAYDNDNVLYVGSVSKTLAPGYRIGWLAAGNFHQRLLSCYQTTALAATLPTQMAVASFINSGGMVHYLRRLRKSYQENMLRWQEKIASSFPEGTRSSQPLGGYFIWVELPPAIDSLLLSKKLFQHNISIAPGLIFSGRQHYRRFIRLNCAIPWGPIIEKALEVVAQETRNLMG